MVGLGRIGTNVAIRAKSFGMRVIAYDPYIKKSKAEAVGVILYDTLEEVLRASDVITFHTPLTTVTRNMIAKKEMDLMKGGVILVNCARGGIVNESDLYDALKSGKVFGAGVDVFEKEPAASNKLLTLENVFATPHIGANTREGQDAVARIICEQVYNALHGRPYENAVNISFMKSQLPPEMQRYFDLAEKMGKAAAQLARGRASLIRVVMVGKMFEEDLCERKFDVPFSYQPFTIAALKGFLEVLQGDRDLHQCALLREGQEHRGRGVEDGAVRQVQRPHTPAGEDRPGRDCHRGHVVCGRDGQDRAL